MPKERAIGVAPPSLAHVPIQTIAHWARFLLNSVPPPRHLPLSYSLCQLTLSAGWTNAFLFFGLSQIILCFCLSNPFSFFSHLLDEMNPLKHSLRKLKKLLRMEKWLSVKQSPTCSAVGASAFVGFVCKRFSHQEAAQNRQLKRWMTKANGEHGQMVIARCAWDMLVSVWMCSCLHHFYSR